jgi:hypothetical protein
MVLPLHQIAARTSSAVNPKQSAANKMASNVHEIAPSVVIAARRLEGVRGPGLHEAREMCVTTTEPCAKLRYDESAAQVASE